MAIRNLRMHGDGILRKISKPVVQFDGKLGELLDDMHDTLKKHSGMGIAAPQVGILKRVIVIDVPKDEDEDEGNENKNKSKNKKKRKRERKEQGENEYGFHELINPVVVESEGEEEMNEACLSLPGKNAPLIRPYRVVIKAFDRGGNEYELEGAGVLARAIFHELDHLDGIMYTDLIEPGTLQDTKKDE